MNETILKNRWSDIDKILDKHLAKYKRYDKNMQDEIQSVFDGIKWRFSEANDYITKKQKDKFKRTYEMWKGQDILMPYTSYKIQKLLRKKNIKNVEVLTVVLEALFSKRTKNLDEIELFTNIAKSSYDTASQETKKKKTKTKNALAVYIASLLALPNKINGNVWSEYRDSVDVYNASQIKNQVLINLQQNKELNIDDFEFQKILTSQQKRYLNKKKGFDKFSGMIDSEIAYIVNNVVLQSYLYNGIKKVRLVAIIDYKTTKMCRSLNQQVFFINKINKFKRYSAINEDVVEYKIKGLESGINLPPITDHFHYCRSTIYREY